MLEISVMKALIWFMVPMALINYMVGLKITTLIYFIYLIFFCKKPTIVCQMTFQNKRILKNMPALYSRFFPFVFTITGFFQSFADRLRWKRVFPDKTILVLLEDGGEIIVDIYIPLSNINNEMEYSLIKDNVRFSSRVSDDLKIYFINKKTKLTDMFLKRCRYFIESIYSKKKNENKAILNLNLETNNGNNEKSEVKTLINDEKLDLDENIEKLNEKMEEEIESENNNNELQNNFDADINKKNDETLKETNIKIYKKQETSKIFNLSKKEYNNELNKNTNKKREEYIINEINSINAKKIFNLKVNENKNSNEINTKKLENLKEKENENLYEINAKKIINMKEGENKNLCKTNSANIKKNDEINRFQKKNNTKISLKNIHKNADQINAEISQNQGNSNILDKTNENLYEKIKNLESNSLNKKKFSEIKFIKNKNYTENNPKIECKNLGENDNQVNQDLLNLKAQDYQFLTFESDYSNSNQHLDSSIETEKNQKLFRQVQNKKQTFFKSENSSDSDNKNIDSIILVHGFNSSSDSNYIRILAHHLKQNGYRVFAFNSRGTKINLKTPIFYHIGWTDDLKYLLDYVLTKYSGKVSLIGFSLGGNWVLKLFGEQRFLNNKVYSERVICGMAVSTPFDFEKISTYFSQWNFKTFIKKIVAKKYKKFLLRNSQIFSEANIDIEKIKKAKSVEEIDNILLKSIFNIDDMIKHYKESSCISFIPSIRKPVMIINSKDDPVVPIHTIDTEKFIKNENIILVLTERGGHLGFVDYSSEKNYLESIAIEYVNYSHNFIMKEK